MIEIQRMMKQLSKEIESLHRSALELSWYSRGAWPYRDVLDMTAGERDLALDFINSRLKVQMKLQYPVY
jgi:hypothetical protein